MTERGRRLLHDAGNPLTAIIGYAGLLKIRSDEGTRLEAADRILESAERLREIVARAAAQLAAHDDDRGSDMLGVDASGRILVVDDDASVRTLLRATLPAPAFTIVEARDGTEAMKIVRISPPDLVVLDWNMPGPSGNDVLAEIRRELPEMPVIVLTAEAGSARSEAEALGASLFLAKPFSPVELISSVERFLARTP